MRYFKPAIETTDAPLTLVQGLQSENSKTGNGCFDGQPNTPPSSINSSSGAYEVDE